MRQKEGQNIYHLKVVVMSHTKKHQKFILRSQPPNAHVPVPLRRARCLFRASRSRAELGADPLTDSARALSLSPLALRSHPLMASSSLSVPSVLDTPAGAVGTRTRRRRKMGGRGGSVEGRESVRGCCNAAGGMVSRTVEKQHIRASRMLHTHSKTTALCSPAFHSVALRAPRGTAPNRSKFSSTLRRLTARFSLSASSLLATRDAATVPDITRGFTSRQSDRERRDTSRGSGAALRVARAAGRVTPTDKDSPSPLALGAIEAFVDAGRASSPREVFGGGACHVWERSNPVRAICVAVH
jgi:hypothetical protein